jgi:hypothetical protein
MIIYLIYNKLKPIKSDEELIFSIIGKDFYGNNVLINPNDAKLNFLYLIIIIYYL